MSKVLFFIADTIPTEAEQAAITGLAGVYSEVAVRTAKAGVANNYGPRLEAADALAGTPPTVYTDAIADYTDGNLGIPSFNPSDGSALFILPGVPAGTTSVAAAAGTLQLRCVKLLPNGAMSEVTAHADMAWTSGTPAKATVGAGTGLVTGAGAGAGSTVITATLTVSGETCTATRTVTVT